MKLQGAKKYIRIMRPDHWIKQLFILPGVAFALFMIPSAGIGSRLPQLILGFFSTCLIASANYVINEWLDREFDRYHPVKKHRSVVEQGADPRIVYGMYAVLTLAGLALAWMVGTPFVYMEIWLWVMGILYNVKPVRTKDIPFVDVLTESINNAIRLLIGWFIVTDRFFPPVSLVLGYWFAGAFLMATKRFSEYRMIGDPKLAGLYRKSFRKYTERSLLLSSFFYAMCSTMFLGICLIKYNVNLILLMPFLIGLFCYYFMISYKEDSAAQKPEKLFREKGLMLYVGLLLILFVVLLRVRIPMLDQFTATELIPIR
ncbi:MAG: UbiA prenyltransferase family protein [Clostridia bacterium]|nr:UbiA prenyltransferase family protein [Clostridia bacterium]